LQFTAHQPRPLQPAREDLMARPDEDSKPALFDGLTDNDVDRFFDLTTLQSFKNEDVIIKEGDSGDGMFVVASGEVRVEKATIDQKQELLAILGPGECFGELSLVDRMPRSATVRASSDTGVYVFGQADLDEFFAAHPDIHRKVLQNLAKITSQRLRWYKVFTTASLWWIGLALFSSGNGSRRIAGRWKARSNPNKHPETTCSR